MASAQTSDFNFPGTLANFVGSIFPASSATHATPEGGMTADAKETLKAQANGLSPDGSPILAPAHGPEAILSKGTNGANVVSTKSYSVKRILLIAAVAGFVFYFAKKK